MEEEDKMGYVDLDQLTPAVIAEPVIAVLLKPNNVILSMAHPPRSGQSDSLSTIDHRPPQYIIHF